MRALGLLFIVVLVVAAIGWFRGWFQVSTTHASGRDQVEFTVDRDRLEQDAAAAKDKVVDLVDGKQDWRDVTAELAAVDSAARLVRVRVGDSSLEMPVAGDAAIISDGRSIPIDALHAGDRVRVTTTQIDGRSVVVRLERV